MKDLLCLVADTNMKAVVQGLLGRPDALGTRPIDFEIIVHPRRDPGCFNEAVAFLEPIRANYRHGLVMLDRAWEGAPASTAHDLRHLLLKQLEVKGLETWADVVVLDPELEVWVFSDSPNVDVCLGWLRRQSGLRDWLQSHGLWAEGESKPKDPKQAVERALREVGKPRSSSMYRQMARDVSVKRCVDPAFQQFSTLLRHWFPANQP
jgi:hypothetical protein